MFTTSTYRLLIALILLLPTSLVAQETTVYGQIKEDTTIYNVMFAKVYFMGTQVGTTSDSLGRFRLTIPTKESNGFLR